MKSPTPELIVETSGAVASIEINRPDKRNSLSPAVLDGIADALGEFSEDGSVRCVVLSGRGGKAFSSGYDFSFVSSDDIVRDYGEEKHPLARACDAIESFPRPVIAMVGGYAVGGGLELACACDFIICSDDAKFSMPPAKLGIAYPFSGLRRITEAVGSLNAGRMFFTAETFTARQALAMGLVSEVAPTGSLRETAGEMARRIAENAPLSIEAAKKSLNIWRQSLKLSPEHRDEIRKIFEKVQQSSDFKEGMKSVSEKRKPVFKGF